MAGRPISSMLVLSMEDLSIYKEMEAAFERAMQRLKQDGKSTSGDDDNDSGDEMKLVADQAPPSARQGEAAPAAVEAEAVVEHDSRGGGGKQARVVSDEQEHEAVSNTTALVETTPAPTPSKPSSSTTSRSSSSSNLFQQLPRANSQQGLSSLAVVTANTSPKLARALVGIASTASPRTLSSTSLNNIPEDPAGNHDHVPLRPTVSALEAVQNASASSGGSGAKSPTLSRKSASAVGFQHQHSNTLAPIHSRNASSDDSVSASGSKRPSVPSTPIASAQPVVRSSSDITPEMAVLSQSLQLEAANNASDADTSPDVPSSPRSVIKAYRSPSMSSSAVKPIVLSPGMIGTKKTLQISRAQRAVLPTFAPPNTRNQRWQSLPTTSGASSPLAAGHSPSMKSASISGRPTPLVISGGPGSHSSLSSSASSAADMDFARRGSLLLPWNPCIVADAKRQLDSMQRTMNTTKFNASDVRYRIRQTTINALLNANLDPDRKRAEVSTPWKRSGAMLFSSPVSSPTQQSTNSSSSPILARLASSKAKTASALGLRSKSALIASASVNVAAATPSPVRSNDNSSVTFSEDASSPQDTEKAIARQSKALKDLRARSVSHSTAGSPRPSPGQIERFEIAQQRQRELMSSPSSPPLSADSLLVSGASGGIASVSQPELTRLAQ